MQDAAFSLATFDLRPALPLPKGQTEETIKALFSSFELDGGSRDELAAYWGNDWRRFVYTYGLASPLQGTGLELGANPYFTTILFRLFTPLHLTLANYFGPHFTGTCSQRLSITDPATGRRQDFSMEFEHFNSEDACFPFAPALFDFVLFCEVIEHLQNDPVSVLREIKRVLKPGGYLILTTPNVSRLENVARMLAGVNIYDPYSGYGPYGRHNREYNRHELTLLLEYCGFEVDVFFTADVHDNNSANFFSLEAIAPLVRFRANDLGQYLFVRARNAGPPRAKRPAWLYRSYPPGDLDS